MPGPPSLTDLLNLLPPRVRTLVACLIGVAISVATMIASGTPIAWWSVLLTFTGGYASHSMIRADSSKSTVVSLDVNKKECLDA